MNELQQILDDALAHETNAARESSRQMVSLHAEVARMTDEVRSIKPLLQELASASSLASLEAALTQQTLEFAQALRAFTHDIIEAAGHAAVSAAASTEALISENADATLNRLRKIALRLVEADQFSKRAQAQSESLEQIVVRLEAAPDRIENVLAQALRRALTIRAGLTKHAEESIAAVFDPIREQVEELSSVTDGQGITEALREIALRQRKMDARLDQMSERLDRLGAPTPTKRRTK